MPSKRGQNEGSIVYVASRQRHWARFTAMLNGKPKRLGKYFKTKREASEWLARIKVSAESGINVAPKKQTVEKFLASWLETVVKPSTRLRTYWSYEEKIRLYINPHLGKTSLQSLSVQDVQGWMNTLLKTGLSPSSVGRARDVLRNALNQACRWDLVPRNVAALVSPPKKERFEYKVLDAKQAKALIEAAVQTKHEAALVLALLAGLRIGEVLGLKWGDIDFEEGTVRISRQFQRIKGEKVLSEPKTTRGARLVPLPAIAVEALRRQKSRQLEARLRAGHDWIDSGMVFADDHGGFVSEFAVRASYAEAMEQAKLEHIRFHDLRHSCASLLLAGNVHMRVVMETLGHSSIALTMNTYSHVMPGLQREANSMDSLLEAG